MPIWQGCSLEPGLLDGRIAPSTSLPISVGRAGGTDTAFGTVRGTGLQEEDLHIRVLESAPPQPIRPTHRPPDEVYDMS